MVRANPGKGQATPCGAGLVVNELERHGQVTGALGRIEQKIDGHVASTQEVQARHEAAISDNAKDIGVLQHRWARMRGGAILTAGVALVLTAVAKARDIF